MDSSEKGSAITGDAHRSTGSRLETGLQGANKVTLGSDKSAEIVCDRVVYGDMSRPMATGGKGEEDSPRRTTGKRSEE